MNYTTTGILLKLDQEREENVFISKEMFDETIVWINRFKTFPEVEFELSGNSDLFLNFLEANKRKIEETLYVYFYSPDTNKGATEEESGVVEGYIEIEDDEESESAQIAPTIKKPPTITITFDELYNMFSHMKNIVDEHTTEIAVLQKQIDQNIISKKSRLLESPAIVNPPQLQNDNILPPMPPPFQNEYSQDTQRKIDAVPSFSTPDEITEESPEELEAVDYDNYEEIEQQAPTATVVKSKLSKGKKIAVIAVMLIALALFVAAQFTLKSVKTEVVQPPATVSAAIAPAPMQNISTATLPPQTAIQPAYETAVPETVKPVVKPQAIESKSAQASKPAFKYTENMKIYVKADHDNTINLKKGEQVEDIQGQDTENWNFTYKPFKITFSTKASNMKNIIIIKTNKTTYRLNLVSSNKGTTLIDLSNL